MFDKELLIELQEYVESHLNVLIYSKMESLDFYVEELEIEDFIKSNRQIPFTTNN